MKKFLFVISITICCFGCKSYTPYMSVPQKDESVNKLDLLTFSNIDTTNLSLPWYISRKDKDRIAIANQYIFDDIRKNYIVSNGNKLGKLEIKCNNFNAGNDPDWAIVSIIPVFYPYYIFTLFGAPTQKNEVNLSYTFRITDNNGRIIWWRRYTYEEETKVGLYYGKTRNRLVLDGVKDIMRRFRIDYEKEFKTICDDLTNPKTPSQLAEMPPATIYLINHPNLSKWSETYRKNRNAEILYVEINGEYIGDFQTNKTLVLSIPQGEVKLQLYRNHNSIFYSSDADIYSSYEEAKANSTYAWNSTTYVKSGSKYYFNITNDVTLKIEETASPSSSILANAQKNVVTYDMRDPKQKLITSTSQNSKKTIPEVAVNQNPSFAKPNSFTSQEQTPTVQQSAVLSLVDKNIPSASSKSSDTYVLIIANENYEYLDDVNYASNDGKIFKEYCSKTLGVPEKQIFYYENATVGKISDGVGKLKYCLDNFEGAKAIVYYCGHGIPDEKSGQAYLIPTDGKATNTSICYSLNKLYKTLAATKAQSITYFMDACFTGANKEGSMLVAARGVARAPEKETLSGKTVVFSASSGDETAMTLKDEGHGLFTYYLLKKLQETEGNVTYGDLADYINRNVKKDAFLINEKPQTPVVATSPAVVNTWKSMKLK